MSTEDILPEKYAYSWSPDSELTLPDFLEKYRPSMVENDGTKPWIWVHGPKTATAPQISQEARQQATEEAAALLKEVTTRVESIKDDASIPLRTNKKLGIKSKKEVREELQAETAQKLQDIANRHGFVSGKWLVFVPPERIDAVWNSIATSITSGPLSATCALDAKVATAPPEEGRVPRLVCVYLPNVFDKGPVVEVMKVLLRNHGLNLSGVKSNLNTAVGLDSKHPSGVPSTTWKNTALIPESVHKALKEEYFADIAAATKAKPAAAAAAAQSAAVASADKPAPKQPVLKKKVADDDPFASDDDELDEVEKKVVVKKVIAKKTVKKDNSDGDEEEEEKPKKAKGKKAAAPKKAAKRAKESDEEEDDYAESEEEQPKKKKAAPKRKVSAKRAKESDSEEEVVPSKRKR
ncbi:hypothetical protein C8J57DRAFT_1283279 [Mycena rebaudengoi]|nr:hypothetical protein C8J57DRAFT_1283279 [Mycena rebaudengoi]